MAVTEGMIAAQMPKKYTVLETWIVSSTKPVESNSAEQTFDRMERVGRGRLPVIDVPIDYGLEEHFLDEARIRDFAAHMGNAQEVLNIGSGDGWPLLRIAPLFRAVTGAEPAQRRVDTVNAGIDRLGLKNVTVKKTSPTALDFPDNRFDGVVTAHAIEQSPDPYQAIREAFRVLKPGGRFRVFFEPSEGRERELSEGLLFSETADALGYHYSLKHSRPPWERNYLVKFVNTPEVKEEFRKLGALVDRLGSSPSANPEIGLQFLERNRAHIIGASFYELEHFTSETMRETLREAGFVNVKITWSAATLARTAWPRLKETALNEAQAQAVCAGLADLSVRLDAPAGLGEPVVGTKPA
ncbi:class I SAM-dependent methyltransferase [candidate division WOR-3 bacterium]|nr:class I SAM-dependent methyltransferase [candidate division WOR-3 bacterium]